MICRSLLIINHITGEITNIIYKLISISVEIMNLNFNVKKLERKLYPQEIMRDAEEFLYV